MIIRKFKFVIVVVIVLIGCSGQEEGGRGYRYAHGGNYFGTAPSFSPGGTMIVFGSIRNGVGDIFIINTDGTDLRRLTDTEAYEGEPRFSPDGSKIVFISERENSMYGKIFIMNVDGSNQRQLTFGKNYDFEPSFSPDGSKIVFGRRLAANRTEIFIMNSNGTDQKKLTDSAALKGNPHFTRDNRRIRYTVFNLSTQEKEIYEINSNGSKNVLVLKLPSDAYDEAWSNDESKIVCISSKMTNYKIDPDTRTEVIIMNSSGQNVRQLTNTGTYKSHPSFYRDSKRIVFLSEEKDGRGKGQIMMMNIDGSELKAIANNY